MHQNGVQIPYNTSLFIECSTSSFGQGSLSLFINTVPPVSTSNFNYDGLSTYTIQKTYTLDNPQLLMSELTIFCTFNFVDNVSPGLDSILFDIFGEILHDDVGFLYIRKCY